jgi:hypothetical protein
LNLRCVYPEEYPGIEREDILACIASGAELARDCYVEIPLGEKKVVLK